MRRTQQFVPEPPGALTDGIRRAARRASVAAAGSCLAAWALIAAGCATAPVDEPAPPPGDATRPEDIAARPPGPHASFDDFADSHFSGQAWRENVGEGYFGSASVLLPAALALAAAGVSPLDHEIADRARDTSPALGHATLAVLLAGTAAAGLFAPGEGRTASEERWTIAESLLLSVTATQALNLAVGRDRPDSSNHSSFPSGHTSTAFAAATLIDRNSGHWWGIPAYALATATALSRVEARRHFPSDVLAGAALGVLSAGIVDSLHFGGDEEGRGISRRRLRTEVGFEVDPDGRPVVALRLLF